MDDQAQAAGAPPIGQEGHPADPHAGKAGQAAINVEQLAERVYKLFLAEARLARARGEHTGQRRKR